MKCDCFIRGIATEINIPQGSELIAVSIRILMAVSSLVPRPSPHAKKKYTTVRKVLKFEKVKVLGSYSAIQENIAW